MRRLEAKGNERLGRGLGWEAMQQMQEVQCTGQLRSAGPPSHSESPSCLLAAAATTTHSHLAVVVVLGPGPRLPRCRGRILSGLGALHVQCRPGAVLLGSRGKDLVHARRGRVRRARETNLQRHLARCSGRQHRNGSGSKTTRNEPHAGRCSLPRASARLPVPGRSAQPRTASSRTCRCDGKRWRIPESSALSGKTSPSLVRLSLSAFCRLGASQSVFSPKNEGEQPCRAERHPRAEAARACARWQIGALEASCGGAGAELQGQAGRGRHWPAFFRVHVCRALAAARAALALLPALQ